LIVIADSSTLSCHEYYRALFEHAERTGAWESSFAAATDPRP
jgi:superfamily I DNA and/or RNA helicase